MISVRLSVLLACAAPLLCSAADPISAKDRRFFESRIRPVLVQQCYECHAGSDPDAIEGELRVDHAAALLKGGVSGPAVVPGKPEQSLLLSALKYNDYEMPPSGKLAPEVIRDFERWIKIGAPDPRSAPKGSDAAEPETESLADRAEKLWSFQPVTPPEVPTSDPDSWAATDIDRFVRAKQVEAGVAPVADANRDALLRRLCFDLVGLPPTLEQQSRFATWWAEAPQAALERMTDELLASPQYGERWARHWLDVVRYGESTGNSRDVLMPQAWRYRDYVIDAFNDDVPYDRFVTEQIAGDLLDADSDVERDRLTIATGLLAIGSKSLNGGNLPYNIADDQIDVVGKAILGLTVSCARCHDHKFEPIPTADYYALAGIFRSTNTLYGGGTNRPPNDIARVKILAPLGGGDVQARLRQLSARQKANAERAKKRKPLERRIASLKKQLPAKELAAARKARQEKEPLTQKQRQLLTKVEQLAQAEEELKQLKSEAAGKGGAEKLPDIEFALAVTEAPKPIDSPILIRGEPNKRGDVVPRGTLSLVPELDGLDVPSNASGRRELGEWLTDPRNPLTPRVIVNRVWQHLFGTGLVPSVDNFGLSGQEPLHPELLDHLAHRFVHEHNWSIKSLIRELVLTRTYRLSADYHAENVAIDPANVWLWRHSRRRLEAEPLRDAMLAASGQLEATPPVFGSLVVKMGEGEVGRGIKTSVLDEPFPHRSVYLPIIRGIVPEMLKLFDLPEPSNPQGERDVTNVPAQSLFFMNSPFVIEQAGHLASRLVSEAETDRARVTLLYRLAYGREPSSDELERAIAFLSATSEGSQAAAGTEADSPLTQLAHAILASAEFRYVE